jgi:hypothetical protein
MLFLLRPRQTWIPVPRLSPELEERNRQYREAYTATQVVTPSALGATEPAERDLVTRLKDLGALHQSGDLSDEEFAAAKARLLHDADGA